MNLERPKPQPRRTLRRVFKAGVFGILIGSGEFVGAVDYRCNYFPPKQELLRQERVVEPILIRGGAKPNKSNKSNGPDRPKKRPTLKSLRSPRPSDTIKVDERKIPKEERDAAKRYRQETKRDLKKLDLDGRREAAKRCKRYLKEADEEIDSLLEDMSELMRKCEIMVYKTGPVKERLKLLFDADSPKRFPYPKMLGEAKEEQTSRSSQRQNEE